MKTQTAYRFFICNACAGITSIKCSYFLAFIYSTKSKGRVETKTLRFIDIIGRVPQSINRFVQHTKEWEFSIFRNKLQKRYAKNPNENRTEWEKWTENTLISIFWLCRFFFFGKLTVKFNKTLHKQCNYSALSPFDTENLSKDSFCFCLFFIA